MGAGKSAVGRALAVKFNMGFTDLDSLVEETAGMSVADIFASAGEPAFRRMEEQAVVTVAAREKTVIACGGGIVLNQKNIDRLRQSSVIVYLAAGPDTLLERVLKSREKRPLLEVADPASVVDSLLTYRRPLYEKAADIITDTSQLDIAGVVESISEELLKHESSDLEKHCTR